MWVVGKDENIFSFVVLVIGERFYEAYGKRGEIFDSCFSYGMENSPNIYFNKLIIKEISMKYRNRSGFIRRKIISDVNCQSKSQLGQGMTEYIIIVALIALASIAGVKFFGSAVQGQFAGMTAVLGGDAPTDGIQIAKDSAGAAKTDAEQPRTLGTYYSGGQ